MNTDDAIFGTGYFVVGKLKKRNAAIRGRNSLLTASGLGRVALQLPEHSLTILVLNKAGEFSGQRTAADTGRGRLCHCAGAEIDQ
ncbi:YtfJ family protein [Shigella sonnei]